MPFTQDKWLTGLPTKLVNVTDSGSYDIETSESKPSNPKDAIGSTKIPMHLFPATAIALGSLAFLEGAVKYGRSNYREVGVRASVYFDAAARHLNGWFEGTDIDPDSGIDHLGKALACIAILIDAKAAGKLNDDRARKGGYEELAARITPLVAKLKAQHADKSPKHYTIADNPCDCHLYLNQICDKCAGTQRPPSVIAVPDRRR